MPLSLLTPAARPSRPASSRTPRLARGGPACRAITTADMLAAIGEPQVTAEQALAALTIAVDRAIAREARL